MRIVGNGKTEIFFWREIKFYPKSALKLRIGIQNRMSFLYLSAFCLGNSRSCRWDYLLDRDMRASSPRRTAKAAHVTSNDRQDRINAMKMINAMDSQNRGLNRILNRRSPFMGEG